MTGNDDKSEEDSRRFMAFLEQNARTIRETWPTWKAEALRVVKASDGASKFDSSFPSATLEPPKSE